MATTVQFFQEPGEPTSYQGTIVVGHKKTLQQTNLQPYLPAGASELLPAVLESLKPGERSDAVQLWLPGEPPHKLVVGALPEECSRHNSPSHPHALSELVQDKIPREDSVQLLVVLDDASHAIAASAAVARAFPQYSARSKAGDDRNVSVHLLTTEGRLEPMEQAQHVAEAVRMAASLVDTPTSELHTDAFVEKARAVANELGVGCRVIRGEELAEQGFGGLWNVGRAATHPPALVVLSHEPEGAKRTVAWVGKGIVYDTGGLSIKGKTGMPGMKSDMAGAAAVLAGFAATVRSGFADNLHVLLCLAENSVGPASFRPDDILTMYSGRTVEVNNTDAEGRLVLADGVAYASKHLAPDVIVDMATLTGAQLMATGKRHAGLMCNDPAWEERACDAGRLSGDLVHPLPYCPEFFRSEFKSKVADMKNSVKDRMNAQSSCAGQFIAEHLVDYDGPWLHIDIAGPSTHKERGTGYGVALLLTLFGSILK